MKIKVLHVIKTLSLGGAETNLCNLVQAQDPERVETHVAYSMGGEIEARFKSAGIRLFKYANGSHKIKSLASFWIVFRLARYILKNDIRIVHTHIFNAHVWGMIAAKLTGRKVVEHVHDFRYLEREDFLKRRGVNSQFRFIRYLKDLSSIVIVLTRQNRDYIVKNKFYPSERIKEIQNGIPIHTNGSSRHYDAAALRRKFGIPEGRFVVFTPARISAEKNLDLFFGIVPEIAKQAPEILFVISGNGPLLETFKARSAEMGLEEHMRFIGFHPATDEWLAISDLFLLPSILELHSIAVLEAMSMKVPVVLSKDVGCHDDFIRSWKNGVLLKPFSVPDWIQAVLCLHGDKDLRRKIGELGFATCEEQFNIKKISKKIEGVYAELAS